MGSFGAGVGYSWRQPCTVNGGGSVAGTRVRHGRHETGGARGRHRARRFGVLAGRRHDVAVALRYHVGGGVLLGQGLEVRALWQCARTWYGRDDDAVGASDGGKNSLRTGPPMATLSQCVRPLTKAARACWAQTERSLVLARAHLDAQPRRVGAGMQGWASGRFGAPGAGMHQRSDSGFVDVVDLVNWVDPVN